MVSLIIVGIKFCVLSGILDCSSTLYFVVLILPNNVSCYIYIYIVYIPYLSWFDGTHKTMEISIQQIKNDFTVIEVNGLICILHLCGYEE